MRNSLLFTFLAISLQAAFASERELCLYRSSDGRLVQVNSRSDIPEQFRASARCFAPRVGEHLAQPDEVNLSGNLRQIEMTSSLGRIKLRWPRKVEKLFGRTPERAMADAAQTASRVLKRGSFPPSIQTLTVEWNVVFMDEELPETQIPHYLISNCHPAWMTPPANLYVVSQRVVAGCSGGNGSTSSINDGQLAQVLLHEIGHVIEFNLLEGRMGGDRLRAEGFASWFEQYSSDFSSVIPSGKAKSFYLSLARQGFNRNPDLLQFSGGAEDYARASMIFHAIVERRNVSGLVDVYQGMLQSNVGFFDAIEKTLGWDMKRLAKEVQRVVGG